MKLTIALLSIILATLIYLFLSSLQQAALDSSRAAEKVGLVKVLKYKSDLAAGTRVTNDSFHWVEVVEGSTPETAFISINDNKAIVDSLVGLSTLSNLDRNEFVLPRHLTMRPGGYMSRIIKNGKKAYSLKVPDFNAAGGFITPGDYVDVVALQASEIFNSAESVLEPSVVISDIRVLAVGNQVIDDRVDSLFSIPNLSDNGTTGPNRSDSVTLELTQDEIDLITFAMTRSQISLALKRSEDLGKGADLLDFTGKIEKSAGNSQQSLDELIKKLQSDIQTLKAQSNNPARKDNFENTGGREDTPIIIINGGEMEKLEFN